MTELVPTSPRPLAIDKRGRAFQVPDSAIEWLVLENTGGRPRNIEDEDGHPTTVAIDADLDDIAQVVGDETELILVPRDINSKKLPMRAHISLTPDAMGGWQSTRPAGEMDNSMAMAAMQHMFSLNNRLIAVTESNAMVFHNAMKTMADAVTELQRGSVSMLEAANTTIKVANGVEALEREPAPQVDVVDLAEQLEDTIIAELKSKPNQPVWLGLATMAFQEVRSLAKTYLASDRGKADAAKYAQAVAQEEAAQAAKQTEAKPKAEPEAKPTETETKPAEAEDVPERDEDVEAGEEAADAEKPAADSKPIVCTTPPPWFSTSTSTASASDSLAMYCQEPVTPERVTAPAAEAKRSPAPEADHTPADEPNVPASSHPGPQVTAPTSNPVARASIARAPIDQPSSTIPTDSPNKDDPATSDPTTQ